MRKIGIHADHYADVPETCEKPQKNIGLDVGESLEMLHLNFFYRYIF